MSKRAAAALPRPGEGKRGPGGHLGYLLRQAFFAYRHRMDAVLSTLSLTAPQFAAMTMLDAYPGHSNADLARLAMLTPQTMSVIVANLTKAGLVERHPHAVHGRIRHLTLTPAGMRLLARAKSRVYALENDLVTGLPARDEGAVRRWLAAIATADQSAGDNPPDTGSR